MSAAIHEFRSRYRAAQARLWQRPVKPPVARDILFLRAVPALIYDEPIGPRKPAFADSAVPPSSHHDAKRILREVATKWGVSVTDIVSDRRSKIVVSARHEACYRLRHETTWSLPRIGGFLGGRDHTTALHGVRKHAERMGLPT